MSAPQKSALSRRAAVLPVDELVLLDVDAERLVFAYRIGQGGWQPVAPSASVVHSNTVRE